MNSGDTPWGKITALLATLAAVAVWWLVPAPAKPRQVASYDEAWALPVLRASNPDKSLVTLTVVSPWGKKAAAGDAPALQDAVQNEPDWRFEGVTIHGTERLLLVRVAGQPSASLKEGDTLPGGAKIMHIHSDSLCLLIKGKQRNLDIFQ